MIEKIKAGLNPDHCSCMFSFPCGSSSSIPASMFALVGRQTDRRLKGFLAEINSDTEKALGSQKGYVMLIVNMNKSSFMSQTDACLRDLRLEKTL